MLAGQSVFRVRLALSTNLSTFWKTPPFCSLSRIICTSLLSIQKSTHESFHPFGWGVAAGSVYLASPDAEGASVTNDGAKAIRSDVPCPSIVV